MGVGYTLVNATKCEEIYFAHVGAEKPAKLPEILPPRQLSSGTCCKTAVIRLLLSLIRMMIGLSPAQNPRWGILPIRPISSFRN